ncbi:DUF2637 domain-containing protein [Micromonospora chersina]|uniref:DUF2637 domain-containing protein n=1 Tax=Micromonospora chersina TaxID=47854 RepID=A0A1C6UST0_9ACTN|nr:DUF2637 domain-containing protein [Micromonospora chersina]SCL57145.1 Protein of unknown function [Micromonospora chersina]
MNARRVASLAGTVAVTVIAAVGSYDHMRELAHRAGQGPLLAALLPLSVDGMILVATLALNDGRRSRWSAWLAFLVGVAASLAANVIVADPDPVARVVSAWPAVALLLTVEVLARSGKDAAVVPAEVVPQQRETAPEGPGTAAPADTREESAEGPSEPHSGSHSPEPEQPRRKRRPAAETRRLAAVMLAEPGATRERVASALGITPRRLRQVLNMA